MDIYDTFDVDTCTFIAYFADVYLAKIKNRNRGIELFHFVSLDSSR